MRRTAHHSLHTGDIPEDAYEPSSVDDLIAHLRRNRDHVSLKFTRKPVGPLLCTLCDALDHAVADWYGDMHIYTTVSMPSSVRVRAVNHNRSFF